MNQIPCQCLYCGSKNVTEVVDDNLPNHANRVFVCHSCQFMFTDLEQRLENSNIQTKLQTKSANKADYEDVALNHVQKILTQNKRKDNFCYLWNIALICLFDHDTPLQHPLEFMIYRDICQISSAFHHNHILKECNDYNPIADSNMLMDVLINNLNHLEYFLKSYDEEKRFAVLKSLGDAMLIFGSCPIDKGFLNGEIAEKFINSNMEKRTSSLHILAKYLKDLQATAHGIDSLRIARALLMKCLGTTGSNVLVYLPSRVYYKYRPFGVVPMKIPALTYVIPDKTFKLTKERLQPIESILKQKGLSFAPEWHDPVKLVATAFVIVFSFAAILYFFGNDILHFFITHKDFSIRMIQLVVGFILIFPIYGFIRVFYTMFTTHNTAEKEHNKSLELYKQLYNSQGQR